MTVDSRRYLQSSAFTIEIAGKGSTPTKPPPGGLPDSKRQCRPMRGARQKQSGLAPDGQENSHAGFPCAKSWRWGVDDPSTEAGAFQEFQENDCSNVVGQDPHFPDLRPEEPCGDACAHGGMDGNRSIICGAQFNIKMKIEGRPSPCSGHLQHRHFVEKHRDGARWLPHEDVWR